MTPEETARIVEALLFASTEPLSEADLVRHLPEDAPVAEALAALVAHYATRGIRLERHGAGWSFRTSPDTAPYLERSRTQSRRFSQAAMETLAIVAYHQPVTRAEIEAIRGVAVAKGTLDQLMEAGWVRPKGRRETAGRPVTWVTTDSFLDAFDLEALGDLPKREELDRLGLLAPVAEDEIADRQSDEAS